MQMNLSKKDKLWYAFIAIAVILPCIPGVIGGSFFGHVATMVLLYASMAQSWNIISGYGGQVSFGHSVFFGIGAYGAGLAVVTFGSLPWFGAPLGMLAAAAVSIIISYPCFKLKGPRRMGELLVVDDQDRILHRRARDIPPRIRHSPPH